MRCWTGRIKLLRFQGTQVLAPMDFTSESQSGDGGKGGGERGIRTPESWLLPQRLAPTTLLIRQALSTTQPSLRNLVGLGRFELPTSGLANQRSVGTGDF